MLQGFHPTNDFCLASDTNLLGCPLSGPLELIRPHVQRRQAPPATRLPVMGHPIPDRARTIAIELLPGLLSHMEEALGPGHRCHARGKSG